METVRIETTQHVLIDYKVAGIGDRILAVLVDYLILTGYVIGVTLFVSFLGGFKSGGREGSLAFLTVIFLPFLFYDLLCEIFMNGQSFGKKVLKIKVTKLDGSQPGIADYLLRWLLRFVDVTLLWGSVAIVTILVNGKGQRLGDIAAGTSVVKIKPAASLEDTILTELEENYAPAFSQVSLLNDQDIATIKKVLSFRVEDSKKMNHLHYKTKVALEEKMGIKSDMTPLGFLETILKDYNALVLRQEGVRP